MQIKKRYIAILLIVFIWQFPAILKWYGHVKYREPTFPTEKLPIQKPVTIYMNDYKIPYIHAQTDSDLAFTLGLMHSHLRLPQMEIFRLMARGELSKMLGPIANKMDHTLRIMQFNKVTDQIIQSYSQETKAWLQAYIDGINYYIRNVKELPWDMNLLQIKPDVWTMQDLVTGFRVTTADVNWVYLLLFLSQSKNPEWEKIWDEYVKHSQGSLPSAVSGLVGLQESGSNALVIGRNKTASGSGMIASDPHVSIFMPSLWVLCGYESPSYHAVGMTIPGLPMTTMGRNENIAWGATNMYSISTFLYELEPKDMEHLTTIEQKIPTRFMADKSVEIRNSMYGPVISDSPYVHSEKPLAMQWMGHQFSDEITAMLSMNRAKNWNEFQKSFYSYSILGLNYVYTDTQGNVGYVPAYRQPLTKSKEKRLTFSTQDFTPSVIDEAKLPRVYNPKEGFIASANNRPIEVKRDWGWFYAPDDRTRRQQNLVNAHSRMDMEMLKKLQVDTKSESAVEWIQWISQNIDEQTKQNILFQKLLKWNGDYEKEKIEPVIFELFLHALGKKMISKRFQQPESIKILEQTLFLKDLTREILAEEPIETRSLIVQNILDQIHWKSTSYINWGEFHPMKVQFALGYLPWIGKAFQYDEMPASGSTDTLFKRSFLMTESGAAITYGSSARHISDMSDLDSNYFVLYGGQNGYPFSKNIADQIPLWEAGQYIQMPMRLETVKKQFQTVLELKPN